jgi:hypothetical protein
MGMTNESSSQQTDESGASNMTKYLLLYQVPSDRATTAPGVTAFNDWVRGMGHHVIDPGEVVQVSTSVGSTGPDMRVAGYALIRAGDLEAAVAVAGDTIPAEHGAGVEIGELARGLSGFQRRVHEAASYIPDGPGLGQWIFSLVTSELRGRDVAAAEAVRRAKDAVRLSDPSFEPRYDPQLLERDGHGG